MGIGIGSRCSGNPTDPNAQAPNPRRYKLVKEINVYGSLVVTIQYEGCTNFEGKKTLVYKGISTFEELERLSKKSIDPHFSNSTKVPTPFARFEPTEEGWDYAIELACLFVE